MRYFVVLKQLNVLGHHGANMVVVLNHHGASMAAVLDNHGAGLAVVLDWPDRGGQTVAAFAR